MAFSKAKLLRFNDIKSCAPPPGAYNPKYDKPQSVNAKQIFTNDKTAEPPSPASSDTKSVHSCVTVPTFKTPSSLPRKKKIGLFNSTSKKTVATKLFSPRKNEKNEEFELLKEKIVECQNKDETIKDMGYQIEELKQLINSATIEKEKLIIDNHEANEKYKSLQNEFEDLRARLLHCNSENESVSKELEKVQEELAEIRMMEETLKEELTRDVEEKEAYIIELKQELEEKEKSYQSLSEELIRRKEENLKLIFQYEESLHVQADLQNRHATELETLKKQFQTEIEDLEYELLKVITESEKTKNENMEILSNMEKSYQAEIETFTSVYNSKITQIKVETEAQIRQSEENCTEKIKLAEIQMEETCKEIERNWESKMEEQQNKAADVLKECQSIAEFNIIQCEYEKQELKKQLAETETLKESNENLTKKNEELESSITNLKTDLSKIIIELNDTREKLGTEIELRQNDLEEAIRKKHLYEFTLNKTYETVNALKSRLLHSDRDVEQLKEELENVELLKLTAESKVIQLTEDLQNIKKMNEELLQENILMKDIPEKVVSLEIDLLSKIDTLKSKSDSEISNLNKIIQEKQSTLNELHTFVNLQQKTQNDLQLLLADAKNEIERQETEFIDYKFQISRLESNLNNTNKELSSHEQILHQKNELIEQLKKQLQEKDSEINEITNIYKKYVERNKSMEKNYDDLVIKCQKLEKIIGEQNNLIGPYRKQLMNRNKSNLFENKNEYEAKISQQNRTIENLKQEIATLNNKTKRRSKSLAPTDKENICSPVRQFNTSLLDSPGNGSPLKERN